MRVLAALLLAHALALRDAVALRMRLHSVRIGGATDRPTDRLTNGSIVGLPGLIGCLSFASAILP